jgi:hypothetical protein
VTGDADLYIGTRTASNTKSFKLPSRTEYTWRSLSYGSDSLSIDYTDPAFCSQCEYIIAVYGYSSNATYSLSLSEKESSVVRLSPNRPLHVTLEGGETMYFTSSIVSSLADVTIALTPLNTGQADLYLKIHNATTLNKAIARANDPSKAEDDDSIDQIYAFLPDPGDYDTYDYTTEGTEDNHVYLPRPHAADELIVITVRALSDIDFAIVASTSDRPTILQVTLCVHLLNV